MKNKLEQKLDAEFKRMNVKPFIHHFIVLYILIKHLIFCGI
jgi:hypothetical protein